MSQLRFFALFLAVWSIAPGQSVRSTHSGVVYFFEGYVFIGDQQLQQKFGRFPEIGEGGVLRTELGRAEVLLTPGVFLRVDENSAVRMQSDRLTDTRIELLRGSAILEVSHEAVDPPDTLLYKGWLVRLPQDSIARIDSGPPRLRVLSGTAEVSAEDSAEGDSTPVTVRRGEVLPFASVLVPEQATTQAVDAFNLWAMNRSSVVSEDNTIAEGITDDPNQLDTSGAALGGFTYFPQTGIPSLGITYPYGLSFWSLDPLWVNPYLSLNPYGVLYQPLPLIRPLYPRPITIIPSSGLIGGPFHPSYPRTAAPLPRIPITVPHATAPHVIRR